MNPKHQRQSGRVPSFASNQQYSPRRASQTTPSRPAYDDDEYEADERAVAALMTQRYDRRQVQTFPAPDGTIYQSGNDRVYVHQGSRPVASRATRSQQALPPPRDTDEVPMVVRRPRIRLHWLFFVGLAFLVMVLGWIGLNAFGAWWQVRSDDGTYGRPRTFQTDAVVGHGDSAAHPSHFMAINLNRHVVIIEIPGGDISKSVIYSAGDLLGNGQDLTPITLSFADVNGDTRIDMVVHIGPQTVVFLNNGTKFVPPTNLVFGGTLPPALGG